MPQKYSKPEALWSELANAPEGTQERWYNKAVAYWDSQEASVNGVLGGYGHVSDDDITESRKFLFKVGCCRGTCPRLLVITYAGADCSKQLQHYLYTLQALGKTGQAALGACAAGVLHTLLHSFLSKPL